MCYVVYVLPTVCGVRYALVTFRFRIEHSRTSRHSVCEYFSIFIYFDSNHALKIFVKIKKKNKKTITFGQFVHVSTYEICDVVRTHVTSMQSRWTMASQFE